jgi:hypothetical protein
LRPRWEKEKRREDDQENEANFFDREDVKEYPQALCRR